MPGRTAETERPAGQPAEQLIGQRASLPDVAPAGLRVLQPAGQPALQRAEQLAAPAQLAVQPAGQPAPQRSPQRSPQPASAPPSEIPTPRNPVNRLLPDSGCPS